MGPQLLGPPQRTGARPKTGWVGQRSSSAAVANDPGKSILTVSAWLMSHDAHQQRGRSLQTKLHHVPFKLGRLQSEARPPPVRGPRPRGAVATTLASGGASSVAGEASLTARGDSRSSWRRSRRSSPWPMTERLHATGRVPRLQRVRGPVAGVLARNGGQYGLCAEKARYPVPAKDQTLTQVHVHWRDRRGPRGTRHP